MLSRLPRSVTSDLPVDNLLYSLQISALPLTTDEIRNQTSKDGTLSKVITYLLDGIWPDVIDDNRQLYYKKRSELSIEDGMLLWGLRVVIPAVLKDIILQVLHHEHPGMLRMKALSRIHVWFPNIDKEIENSAKMYRMNRLNQ